MKRMLINGTHAEEMRIALVDGQKLYDLDIESKIDGQKKSNIYKAIVTRVEPSLEAVFVDYGQERHGFLPFKEIDKSYLSEEYANAPGRPNIKEGLKTGTEIIVQVDKEERGNKGAALTTFISLAGRYLVLMPNNPRGGGVSRRIEGEDRAQIREALNDVTVPKNMSTIVRTAGVGRSAEELQWDLDYLAKVWEAVSTAASDKKAPFLIYQESNIIIRALRDYYRDNIKEILIDTPQLYQQAHEFVQMVMPEEESRVKLYQDPLPLFTRYQVESQIETAFQREVKLPSGGALVIDYTEALVSIDINSARSTKGADIEETARHTNLEAAEEIARQMRLRDLGGLLVIDFIDMSNSKAQRDVENCLREALSSDRARVQIGRISKFGLLELSRQRLRPSLDEASHITCPRCGGQGSIRNIQSLSLAIVRLIQEEAIKDKTGRVLVHAPVKVATYLLNEKRQTLHKLEDAFGINISIIPSEALETPHFTVVRQREDDVELTNDLHSFEMDIDAPTMEDESLEPQNRKSPEIAAVQSITHSQPAPAAAPEPKAPPQKGFFAKLFGSLAGTPSETATTTTETTSSAQKSNKQKNNTSANRSDNQQKKKSADHQNKNKSSNSGNKATGKSKSDNRSSNRQKNTRTSDNKDGNKSQSAKSNNTKRQTNNNRDKQRSDHQNNRNQKREDRATKPTKPREPVKKEAYTVTNDQGQTRQVYAGRERIDVPASPSEPLPQSSSKNEKTAASEKAQPPVANTAIATSAPLIASVTQSQTPDNVTAEKSVNQTDKKGKIDKESSNQSAETKIDETAKDKAQEVKEAAETSSAPE